MTQTPPPLSRRSARSLRRESAVRATPEVRPLADGDFFDWVGLYAGSLEELGMSYRDEVALRTWHQLGFAGDAHAIAGLESIVVGRSGNLVGFAISSPTFSALDGSRLLDVHACFVERVEYDGEALEAIILALHERASAAGAERLRWLLPESASKAVKFSKELGESQPYGVYEMPVQSMTAER